ncbi:MAG: transcriptional repressor LexA [Patescibacteria group bacterium]|nr:transcriptional repressor LexA [Patescibacteria group bacterium]
MRTKTLSKKESEAIRLIRNSLVHMGQTPSVRELMASLGYRSPRSASVIIDKLIDKGFLVRKDSGKLKLIKDLKSSPARARTVKVPLVGEISCGMPVFAEENFEMMIPVSINLAPPPHKYFLLRAKGDSMNKKKINDRDLVLVRQQSSAETGDSVVAIIDDEATIKELQISNNAIILKPRSTNKEHQPIILDKDFLVQGVVVGVIPDFE